jgi:hypothetical protein
MAESQLAQIESINIGINRPNRIIRVNIFIDARGQKATLGPDRAGFE